MQTEDPIQESIKQVDDDTWLIGPLILHCSSGYSDTATWYDRDDDLSYTLTDAPNAPPAFMPLTAHHPSIELVYHAGNSSAVWSIGNSAFCKVKLKASDITSEAATLQFVQKQQPGFKTPNVLYQAERVGRSYLFLSRVPGRTLADAWPTLTEEWKHHYVNAIVKVCQTLECWKGNMIAGVHGKNVPEPYLVKCQVPYHYNPFYTYEAPCDYSPANLRQSCEAMGMNCSEFVFYHTDLGPGNIIVEDVPNVGSVGIIDWEAAGYFPRAWIRTKFRINNGLNLPLPGAEGRRWRWEVQKLLGQRGFEEYSEEWESWWF